MSRPFPLLRSNLQAVKDAVTHGDAILWMGWVCLLVTSAIGTAFFFLWKGLLSNVVGNIIAVLPLNAGEEAQVTINICFGLFLLLFVLCWAYSACWMHADQMTFRSGDRERLLARLIPLAGAVGRIIAVSLGIAVVGWALAVAVAARLEGSLPHAHLIVLGSYGVLLLPLTARLWYLPTIASLENDNAAGPWAMLLQATSGRLVDLVATIVVQAMLLAVCVYAFELFVANLASPLWAVATSGGYTSAAEWASAIRSQVSAELVKALGLWALVCGPLMMVVAAMQVATIRFLVGIADHGRGATESHFSLNDDGKEEVAETSEKGRDTPADPLRPQFAQLDGDIAKAVVPETPAVDESRELPDELLVAARAEEASLRNEAPDAAIPEPEAPTASAPTGQFAQFSQPDQAAGQEEVTPSASAPPPSQFAQFSQQAPAAGTPAVAGEPPPAQDPPAAALEMAEAPPPPPPEGASPVEMPPPSDASEPERPTLHPPVGGDDDEEIGELPTSPLDRFRKS